MAARSTFPVIPLTNESQLFRFPDQFEWLPPWIKLPDDYAALIPISFADDHQLVVGRGAIVAELRREMPESHVLYSAKLDAVAVHVECGYKDFVFATDSEKHPIAVVHLTYNVESDPHWPSTKLICSLEEWRNEMQLDYQHAGEPKLDCSSGHYRMISRQIENEPRWFCARCGERNALTSR